MPQLACIFCQRTRPLVKITKEHLFSRWVDDILTPELLGPDRSFERTVGDADGVRQARSWPVEIIAVIEAPVVCGSCDDGCNEGWMSGLDGQVKQIIQPMMLGESAVITPQEQLVIATWAAMKAMVLEYVWGPDQPVVSLQEDRDYLFRERRPPENMQIRLAAVESHGRPVLAKRYVYQGRPQFSMSSTAPQLALCTTFVLGCFVVQTFSEPGLPIGKSRSAPSAVASDYIPIYPENGESVSWPPTRALDDKALDRFTHPLQPVSDHRQPETR